MSGAWQNAHWLRRLTPTNARASVEGNGAVVVVQNLLRGANFAVGASVTIGGVAANNVAVTSAGTITARTPAHATGTVDVVVTNPSGQSSTLSAIFNYADPPTGGGGSSGSKGCGGAGAPVGACLAIAAVLRRLRRKFGSRQQS